MKARHSDANGRWVGSLGLVAAVAALARVPFVWHGFGVHPDEWAVIRSGIDVWLTGQYHISRAPGFPLNEIMMGGLAWVGGGPACAAAAALAGVAAVVGLARLLRLHGVGSAFWPALALAFCPWFWSSGTHALDFVWGVLCVVSAFVCVERGRPYRAAMWSGLGVGFRPSAALWGLAVLLRVLQRERTQGRKIGVAAVMVATGTVAMLPALWAAPEWVLRPSSYKLFLFSWQTTLLWGYHLVEVFGHVPGVLVVLAGLWVARRRVRALGVERPSWLLPHGVLIAIFVLLFLFHNQKLEYFLPAVPSVLLILARCLTSGWWKGLVLVFAANGLVTIDVGTWSRRGFAFAVPHLEEGPLLADARRRAEMRERIDRWAGELAAEGRVVRTADRWDYFNAMYVSSRLGRGPGRPMGAVCRYVPALVEPGGSPGGGGAALLDWPGLPPPPPVPRRAHWPALICCETGSVLTTEDNPVSSDELRRLVAARCGG